MYMGGAISSFKPYCSMNFNQRLETNKKEKTKLLKRLQKWQIKNYHADKLILPVDGIDVKKGFTTYYNKESDIDRAIIEQSELHIVAADFSKIGRTTFANISSTDVADFIVTNTSLNQNIYNELYKNGLNIILA